MLPRLQDFRSDRDEVSLQYMWHFQSCSKNGGSPPPKKFHTDCDEDFPKHESPSISINHEWMPRYVTGPWCIVPGTRIWTSCSLRGLKKLNNSAELHIYIYILLSMTTANPFSQTWQRKTMQVNPEGPMPRGRDVHVGMLWFVLASHECQMISACPAFWLELLDLVKVLCTPSRRLLLGPVPTVASPMDLRLVKEETFL